MVGLMRLAYHTLYMASEDEMRELWHNNGHADIIGDEFLEEAIESTKVIANRCNAQDLM